MEPQNRREAEDQDVARPGAERRREAGEDQQSDLDRKRETLSAIERQKLALSARDNVRDSGGRSRRRRRSRSGSPFVLLALSLVVVIGVAIFYLDEDRSLLKQAGNLLRATVLKIGEPPIDPQNPINSGPPPAQIAAIPEETVPADIDVVSGQIDRETVADPLQAPVATSPTVDSQPAPAIEHAADTPPLDETILPAGDTPAAADPSLLAAEPSLPAAEPSAPPADVFALPVEKLSLHDQPDLFRQVVQLYTTALVDNPNNSEAAEALQRLQDKAYVELESAISAKEVAAAERLLKYTGELFPEMKEELRYQALSALVAQQKGDVAKVVAEQVSRKPPPRPYINALSMSLGTLEGGRFVPRDDGTVVMIRVDYSNFNNPPARPGEDTLILRIRAAGNPLTMAEVPVPIQGDRGTKSFTVDTMIKGSGVEYYQLDFILQGRVLESRVVAKTPL